MSIPTTLSIRLSVEYSEHGHWVPCERVTAMMGDEPIQRCAEVTAVLRAHGRVLVRYVDTLGSRYDKFRILARETVSGAIVAYWKAIRSVETGQLIPWNNGDPIVMCEWCPIAKRCPDRVNVPRLAA